MTRGQRRKRRRLEGATPRRGAHLERVSYYSSNLEGPVRHKDVVLLMLTGMLAQDPGVRKSSTELLREFLFSGCFCILIFSLKD